MHSEIQTATVTDLNFAMYSSSLLGSISPWLSYRKFYKCTSTLYYGKSLTSPHYGIHVRYTLSWLLTYFSSLRTVCSHYLLWWEGYPLPVGGQLNQSVDSCRYYYVTERVKFTYTCINLIYSAQQIVQFASKILSQSDGEDTCMYVHVHIYIYTCTYNTVETGC